MADGPKVDIPVTGEAVADLFARQEVIGLVRATLREEGRASVEGLWGSSAPALAAAVLADCPSTLLYVLAHVDAVDDACDDWRLFGCVEPHVFPAWESLPTEADVSDEVLADRLRLLKILAEAKQAERSARRGEGAGEQADKHAAARTGRATLRTAAGAETRRATLGAAHLPRVIVTTIQAMMQPVPSPRHLAENTLHLTVGRDYDLPEMRAWLAARGFRPAELVIEPGQYAVRGGIIDVYPPTAPAPYRLEFFGDELESLRTFDPGTQRSLDDRDHVAVSFVPAGRGGPLAPETTTNLMDYLPADAWIVWHEPLEIAEMGRSFVARLASPVGVYPFDGVVREARRFVRLDLSSFTSSGASDTFALRTEQVGPFSGKAEAVRDELADAAQQDTVLLFSDNEGERDRMAEIVRAMDADVRDRIRLGVGRLGAGFRLVGAGVAVLPNHEVFQRYQARRRLGRRLETRALDTWMDLTRGDLVVHAMHGIGRYLGMKTLRRSETVPVEADGRLPLEAGEGRQTADYLVLEFRDKVKVYVPADQVDLVQKYVGGYRGKPQLSRVGGKAWSEKKRQAREAVEQFAVELLRMQAVRQARPGIRFPDDSLWQKEFEASFPYPETEDQTAAMHEIKRDMRSARPMDRLVCGDVGYGKTELAIRAAFKAVEAGKQVVALVPTTVLAAQHVNTFRERMADYPVIIEMLCRFQTRSEQAETLDRFRKGQVDILIGTHRLLGPDVAPADLGLLVVDEEQRFGVEHKERVKRMRETVDVLTLTATPIPRTLHLALLGMRDISSLSTAPQDRRAVRTEVCLWDDDRIRQAILRELNRDGQVFFVHNRVRSIEAVADRVRTLVPEARVAWAHGQMNEHELERRMLRFFAGEIDVLVSTTIIESGLDVPRANTMFIHQADRFGLADLHQLRGRVGRYKHRAYCYLLLPENRPLAPAASKRLRAIEQYAELGAGFQIAMRDLEIRGAGNILGVEQSGHIHAVGYEMYCRLLEASVLRLQGKPSGDQPRADVQFDLPAFLPADYVPAESQRISLYRQLQRAAASGALAEVADEIADMYGPPPEEVRRLVDLEAVRVAAGNLGVRSIHRRGADLVFTLREATSLARVLGEAGDDEVRRAGIVRVLDPHTLVWRLTAGTDPARALALVKNVLARPGTAA
ncbi:MAG: transcription-repair coupling factor [Planctomycetes bacterium]|nr:transcription-repair coupling factor [Planctomycetota bacterium]